MNETFKLKTYIPTLSTYGYIEEFNNKNLIHVNKYISFNDDEGLNNYFDSLLPLNCSNSYDKCFVLLCLRSICIGDKISFSVPIDNEIGHATFEVSIKSVLKEMLENYPTTIPDFVKDDLIIKFKQPTKLFYNDLSYLLLDIIDDLSIKDKLKSIKSIRFKEKHSIIKKIKTEILQDIKNHLNTYSNPIKVTNFEEVGNLYLGFFNNSAFKLLKLFYNQNISNIYLKLYHSTQKINISYDSFLNLTPAESDILLTIYKTANDIK